MASQTEITALLKLRSEGIKEATADSEKLNKSLERGKGIAASSGKRANMATTTMENVEYGQARAAGGTGAAGRDFAKQAQGLGGLVHLYATYAANIFAVTAAFQGLSKAMDTTNMVKGLDQLGAATGQSLGTLSKRLVDASDGAINFRDAMEATAKATASGMSQKQLLQLGDIAKKASQALGVSMPDALSRLTRGVTKLEPELLDELGIFTKVGKATEDYARKVGKTVESLTDYEKRQAFANAVAAEGAQKFKDIQIDANPYDKLLSTLQNVSQSILEVINKGLTPLVKLLSESPTALAGIIGGLAIMLVKQALPAIGQYRDGLRKIADDNKKIAEDRAKAAQTALDKSKAINAQEILAEKDKIAKIRDDQVDAAEAQLKLISKKGISKSVKSILAKPDLLSITDKDLAVLDNLGKKTTNVAGTYRLLASAIRSAQEANNDYITTSNTLDQKMKAPPPWYSAAGIAAGKAERARKSAASSSIISQAGEDAAVLGFAGSFGELKKSLSTEKLGLVRGTFTGIAGALNIVTTSVGNLLSVFSRFLGYIGIAITAYELLSGWLATGVEEQEKFNKSVELGNDAVKAATETQKKYKDSLSIEALTAHSTALGNISEALNQQVSDYAAAQDKMGAFSSFIDMAKDRFVPGATGTGGALAKSISEEVTSALKAIKDPEKKKEAEDSLKQLFGPDISKKAIEKAFTSIPPALKKKIQSLANDTVQVITKASKDAEQGVSPLRSLSDGFDAIDKSFAELSNTLIAKDPLSKFALDLIKQSTQLANAFKEPQAQASLLADLLVNTGKIKMFPKETQEGILDAANAMKALIVERDNAAKQIAQGASKITQANSLVGVLSSNEVIRLKVEGEALLAAGTRAQEEATKKLQLINTNLTAGLEAGISRGFGLLEGPVTRAIAQGNIDSQKTLLNYLPKTPSTIASQAKLDLEAISLKREEVSVTRELIKETALLRISNEKDRLLRDRGVASQEGDQKTFDKLTLAINDLDQQAVAYKTPGKLKSYLQENKQELQPGAAGVMAQDTEFRKVMAGFASQADQVNIKKAVDTVQARFDEITKNSQDYLEGLKAENQAFYKSPMFEQMDQAAQKEARGARTSEEMQVADIVARLPLRKSIATYETVQAEAKNRGFGGTAKDAAEAANKEKTRLDVLIKQQDITVTAADAETARSVAIDRQVKSLELQRESAQEKYKLDEQSLSAEEKRITEAKSYLDVQVSLGTVTGEAYLQKTKQLEADSLSLDHAKELLSLQNQQADKLAELAISKAKTQDPQEIARITGLELATTTYYSNAIKNENDLYAARLRTKGLTDTLTDRQKAYGDIFKKSFDSIADAMVSWAETGKWAGKDLFNSLIADLARYEIRLQTSEMYKAFRPGLMSGISALFGGTPAVAATMTQDMFQMNEFAKGGAFDYSLEAFAKGGAFTNSIVDSPTMFKFAKGTGLMGEAGPEAIMPLKRDANGNLGVRAGAGGGSTEVVINNYGSEQATAKETTDSRGNRRIEVTIGDMAAGEITRSGSASQKAVSGTFGLRPQLIRR